MSTTENRRKALYGLALLACIAAGTLAAYGLRSTTCVINESPPLFGNKMLTLCTYGWNAAAGLLVGGIGAAVLVAVDVARRATLQRIS